MYLCFILPRNTSTFLYMVQPFSQCGSAALFNSTVYETKDLNFLTMVFKNHDLCALTIKTSCTTYILIEQVINDKDSS